MQLTKSQRIFLNLVIAIGGTLALQGAALAQHSGTLEQQMACTPDVFRLCGAQIPDENRIVACLRQNTVSLSGPCRAVFESNDSVSAPPQANARVQRAQPATPGRRAAPMQIAPPPSADDDDNQ
jgi:hypothetical protein